MTEPNADRTPLPTGPCPWCKCNPVHPDAVCPWSLTCPTCQARPGGRCKRPSGHDAANMHADRYLLAERLDADAGITYPGQGVRGNWRAAVTRDQQKPRPR